MLGLGAQRQLRDGRCVARWGAVGMGQHMPIEPHVHLRATELVVFRKLVPALTRAVAVQVLRGGGGVGWADRTWRWAGGEGKTGVGCHMSQASGLGDEGDQALGRGGEQKPFARRDVRPEKTGDVRGESSGGHSGLERPFLQAPSHGRTSVGHSPQAGRWVRKSTGSPWRWHRWA